jgi:arsenate reductase
VENPLSEAEIHRVLNMLGLSAKEVLRKNDKAYKQPGLSGQEDEEQLVRYIAEFPTLLQRPIGIKGNKAVLGRPVERLLEL